MYFVREMLGNEAQSGFDDSGSVHAVHAFEASSLRHVDVGLPSE